MVKHFCGIFTYPSPIILPNMAVDLKVTAHMSDVVLGYIEKMILFLRVCLSVLTSLRFLQRTDAKGFLFFFFFNLTWNSIRVEWQYRRDFPKTLIERIGHCSLEQKVTVGANNVYTKSTGGKAEE